MLNHFENEDCLGYAHLDVLAPDGTPSGEVAAALAAVGEEMAALANPVWYAHGRVTVRFGTDGAVESAGSGGCARSYRRSAARWTTSSPAARADGYSGRMVRHIAIVLTLVLAGVSGVSAKGKEAKKMKGYAVAGMTFQAPEAGVEVKEVGVSAHEVALVAGGEKGAWITLYRMSQPELAQVPDAARLASFKATYCGTAKPAEKQVTREFLKRKVSGDWQRAKIPKALTLEAFQVALPDGGALFVGMRRLAGFSEADAAAFFDAFAASLKVE